MTSDKMFVLTDGEIRQRGLEALNKVLGIADSTRFLALVSREPTDSVEWSRRLFEGKTVEEIHHDALSHWKAKKKETNKSLP